jgi:hypothetical protein
MLMLCPTTGAEGGRRNWTRAPPIERRDCFVVLGLLTEDSS